MPGKAKGSYPLREGGSTKLKFARAAARAGRQKKAEEVLEEMPARFEGEYTNDLGRVMARLVTEGCLLKEITTLDGMPDFSRLLAWTGDADHPFHKLYYDAKRARVAYLEEQVEEESNKVRRAVRVRRYQQLNKDGDVIDLVEKVETDNVERSKLHVSVLQWQLGYTAPAKHGPKAEPPKDDKGSAQLEALFRSLKAGPA